MNKTEILEKYQTRENGLEPEEVEERRKKWGLNTIRQQSFNPLRILARQFSNNPLIIVLAIATVISLLVGEKISSYYIFGIIVISVALGFWNEFFADRSIKKLLKRVALFALVVRRGEKMDVPTFQVTIGDIVLLTPGSIIPADLRLLSTINLEIDESTLNGESIPVRKRELSDMAFMGTVVRTGSGRGVVVAIGGYTEFGKIAKETSYLKPETVFQKGLSSYGAFLTWIMAITAVTSFVANTLLGRNILDALLFSLAIAVGLTPELLPVIVTISLAHGAGKLAKKEVLVKQLIAIENLGNIDVLCTDKTGTLTEGKISVSDYLNARGMKDEEILKLGLICNNALIHHKIIGTPYDVAIWEYIQTNHQNLVVKVNKVFEEPFDFTKRLMFTVIQEKEQRTLIVKGAPEAIFNFIGSHNHLRSRYHNLSNNGLNVIAIATKKVSEQKNYGWDDIKDLDFAGFITFSDPPKRSTKQALTLLQKLNVKIKIITGDNEMVTAKICSGIDLNVGVIVQGDTIDELDDNQLKDLVNNTTVFVRVTPEQKLKIVQTLQKLGHAVGYMGDGVNDVLALHCADVGISVNSAIDVAKDTAQVVLLRKGLNTVADGIMEGRKVFSNTIKYILTYTGSNFGEMISLTGASFFMSFLPITAPQLLLQDSLYDLSQIAVTSDNVDPEALVKPKHWDLGFIKNYMLFFGVLGALFIYITFWFLTAILNSSAPLFRTSIFIAFMISEMIVVFSVRTARVPFFKSKPSPWLIGSCFTIILLSIYLPYSPLANSLGFVPLPLNFFTFLITLSLIYLVIIEIGKKFLLRKLNV